MTNLYDRYEINREAFRGGVPVELDGATFRVRYAGAENMSYQTALGVAALKHRDLFADVEGNAARLAELEPEITAAAMFETVLLGWENVSDRDGAPLEFTREHWLDLALSCPRVLMTIRLAAENFSAYRAKRVEEAAENLVGKSDGTVSGDQSSLGSKPCGQLANESVYLNIDQA